MQPGGPAPALRIGMVAQQLALAIVQRYLAAMEWELTQVHIPPMLTRVMLAHDLDDLVAVEFEFQEAFDQTPGPNAGAPIGAVRKGGPE